MSFWCLQISQKNNEIFSRISALASKRCRIKKKIGELYTPNWGFYFDSLTLLFWFELFLEARAEILSKSLQEFRWFFWGDLKTAKGHFEINWPLEMIQCYPKISIQYLDFRDLAAGANCFVFSPIIRSSIEFFFHNPNELNKYQRAFSKSVS